MPAFDAWFRSLDARAEGESLVLRCPDRFSRDWIRSRYGKVLEELVPSGQRIAYELATPKDPEPAAAVALPTPQRKPARAVNFDSFVAGPGNVLALEAARALARGQAGHCSPLVFTGASGVGKTHLCRAIHRELRDQVVYRSSEEFTSEVTGAMRNGKMENFRQRYRRSLNVLILEDVQFLSGKRATQIEFFHTLDHLISNGKSVVLSADCSPLEIEGLDPKLSSRMCSGLVACISPPEQQTRLAILREKAAGGGIRVPDECLEMLAARPVQSVRDLLSGLNQVVARASLLRRSVSLELVHEALGAVDVPGRRRSLKEIIQLTARAYGLTLEEMNGPSRRRRIVQPRQIAMYLCRRYTDASLKEIGHAFSRDHTSVIYAIDVVERRTVERPQLRYELEALVSKLG